ncbi:molybdate ABC transporter substrate-binding protein [uncultured Tateyamaria sp.]|uniref:molybdate ABC transporter substrate-binding protein n=1 Tax=uncultured Tateyamaria sp. TaxID=455651 RepID=UPI002623E52B|nr:molybdate ABC transporter substrate-binding protein [uncultured Tateyamaria sp.]
MTNSACVMKTCKWIKGLAVLGWLACLPGLASAETVRIFAAASLQGPLDQVAVQSDEDVVISYGGSGTIARQISLGAPADAAIIANTNWSDWLVARGVIPSPPRALMSNRLVVVAAQGSAPWTHADANTLRAHLSGGRLAMGQHMSVPAGIYAQAWLDSIGAWDDLRQQLAETENVRAALALVARGEAPLGIVYASDAQASTDVDVVWQVPADAHPPIRYIGLALTPAGETFLDLVAAQTDAFVAAGFVALP